MWLKDKASKQYLQIGGVQMHCGVVENVLSGVLTGILGLEVENRRQLAQNCVVRVLTVNISLWGEVQNT